MHSPQLIAEVRPLTPDDGWARYEQTGRACTVCPCGLNTGFVDKDAAIEAFRNHPAPSQKVQVSLAGGQALTSFIRDRARNGY